MSSLILFGSMALILGAAIGVFFGYVLGFERGKRKGDDKVYYDRANDLLWFCSQVWYYYFKTTRNDSRTADFVANWFKEHKAEVIEKAMEESSNDKPSVIARIRRNKMRGQQ